MRENTFKILEGSFLHQIMCHYKHCDEIESVIIRDYMSNRDTLHFTNLICQSLRAHYFECTKNVLLIIILIALFQTEMLLINPCACQIN